MTIYEEIASDVGELLDIQRRCCDWEERLFHERFVPTVQQEGEFAQWERRFAELKRRYRLG